MNEKEAEKVPEKRSVVLMLFLCIITLGIYPAIWYIKRADEFNGLHTEKQLNKGLTIFLLIVIIAAWLVLPLGSILRQFGIIFENPIIEYLSILPIEFTMTIQIVIYLILILLYLSLAFRARTIINDALERKGIQRKISGFFTLIFNLFYLQYEVNRVIDNKEEEKRIAPWIILIIILVLAALSYLFRIYITTLLYSYLIINPVI